MGRTVLFFGDSNTRGYGVGRERRYAAYVETALAPEVGQRWRFVVRGGESDFHAVRDHLYVAVAKYRPDILVWQCPTGPAAYFVNYPAWLRPLRAVFSYGFERRRESSIRREQGRAAPALSSRRDVLYDGRYLDALHRVRPSALPVTRHANEWLAARYGLIVKATRERYLELMARHRDQLRTETDAHLLLVGFLPHLDHMYPGYHDRVTTWGEDLRQLFHAPEKGSTYLDVYATLAAHPRRHLLRDGTHLDVGGHRRVAELVVPVLRRLLTARQSHSSH